MASVRYRTKTANGRTITNSSWQDCEKRYERPHTFFHIGPPYWQTEGHGVQFEWEQYQLQAATIRSCRNSKLVMESEQMQGSGAACVR
jgi:DNA adenine methylase